MFRFSYPGGRIIFGDRSRLIACGNPNYALILGMARKISTQPLMDLEMLELDSLTAASGLKDTANVLHQF